MIQIEKVIDFHTFSITARDRETGAFGVAVATARPNVGSLVPWVSPRGAIATQARVNTELGRQGLALLTQGVPVDVALTALLRKDSEREIRQVHGLDGERVFCHTGASCVPWCGHEQADEFTIAGNMVRVPAVCIPSVMKITKFGWHSSWMGLVRAPAVPFAVDNPL